jgi:hypothetical protein
MASAVFSKTNNLVAMSKTPRKKPSDDSDRPARPKIKRTRQGEPSGDSPFAGAEPLIAAPELDLRTLVLLSMGDWSELADLEWPPDTISRWLEKADIRQVRGMLLMTLHRWHELRRGEE